jgi:crotonobetainyl-CoA:carnitine CoA-transferase CaiB-like acyl-CoA transferase
VPDVTEGDRLVNRCSRLPLTGIRIAEMPDGKGEMCGRYLGDLGAEVIFIEPRTGAKSRRADPMLGDVSLYSRRIMPTSKG